MNRNKGISLIILVITIIITIIIASVVIMSLDDNKVMNKATEASFKTDIGAFKESLSIYLANNIETMDNPVTTGNFEEIQAIIPNFTRKYHEKIKIVENKIAYIGDDIDEENWAKEIGVMKVGEKALVKVVIEGKGTVSGATAEGTNYMITGNANLVATAGKQIINDTEVLYKFDGWYEDGILKSTETTFSPVVSKATTYTAIFIPQDCSLIYKTVDGVENVQINTSTTLASYANDTTITKMEIGSKVTIIGASAFSGCTGLTNVTIPQQVKTISKGAFAGCIGLSNIDILGKVTLGDYPFVGCKGLKTVNIYGVTFTLGYHFKTCTGLQQITLGSKGNPVTGINSGTFNECVQGNLTIKIYTAGGNISAYEPWGATNATIEYYSAETGELVKVIQGQTLRGNKEITEIPNLDKITKIKERAFNGCTGLTNVTIPATVTYIGTGAFAGCIGLSNIDILGNVTLEDYPFSGCTGLKTVNIHNVKFNMTSHFINCTMLEQVTLGSVGNPIVSINASTFAKCVQGNLTIKVYTAGGNISTYEPWGATNATIEYYSAETGELVKVIQGQTLRGNKEITEIPNLDKITKIKERAFNGCTGLTNVTIPATVTYIGTGAFAGCIGLSNIDILGNVTLEDYPFSGCTALKTANIHAVTFTYNSHFIGCTALKQVTIGSIGNPVPTVPSSIFSGCKQSNFNIKIYKADGSTLSTYKYGANNATIEYYSAETGEKMN